MNRTRQARHMSLLIRQLDAYARLLRLHRPTGLWLLLWPTLWGLWLASDGQPDPHVLGVFVIGTLLMRSAGCAVNDFADRRLDPHVRRTRDRPLATGEVSPAEALVLSAGLALIALGLVLTLNRLTQLLAVVGALLTVVYPFTKRWISTPQLVLGLAFGWGVPMAFAAQTGQVGQLGWLTYCAVILWAVIYDTQYAMVDREDDLKMGARSSAILFGDADRVIVGLLQLILLATLLLIGQHAGLGGWYQGAVAVAAGLACWQQWLMRHRDRDGCFRAFCNNHPFGAVIFTGIALDHLYRLAPPA